MWLLAVFFFLSLFVFFKKCFGLVVRFLFLGGLLLQGLTMYVVQLAMASPEFKWVNAELEDSYWSFPLKPALRPWTMCPFVLAVSAKCACQCGMEIAESMLTSDSVSEVMWTSDGMCHFFFFASNVGGRWHGALNVHALICVMLHTLVSCSKDAANFFSACRTAVGGLGP